MAAEQTMRAEDVLLKLVAEIAANEYSDREGHRLTRNTAYLEATAFLQLQDALERTP